MNSKLKPCPFCGDEAMEREVTYHNTRYYIKCTKCGAGSAFSLSEQGAINAWNTRAYEPKSGTWKLESEFEGTKTWECPFCHEVYYFDDFTYKFCPACGAHLEMEEQS